MDMVVKSRTIWTTDLDALLIENHSRGLTFTEIGKIIGVSKNAIAGRCHRLNLEHRPRVKKDIVTSMEIPEEDPIDEASTTTVVSFHVEPEIVDPKGAVEAILALQWRSCRYSFGDTRSPDFHFCMETSLLGKSFCREHYDLVYPKEKRR